MKRLSIILGMVLAGTLLAEAALPTLLPLLVGSPTVIDTGLNQPTTPGGGRLYGSAYNSLDDEYMAAWGNKGVTGSEIRIQRVDKDGVPVGAYSSIDKAALTIPMSSPGAMSFSLALSNPQISYSPLTNEYLLVFEAKDAPMFYGVFAQRLDPTGALLGEVADIGAFGPYDKKDPQVTWGGSQWLVAWGEQMWMSGSFVTGQVNGQYVNTDGKKEGSEIAIVPDGSANHQPVRVDYNSASDTFLLVSENPANNAYFGYLLDNVAGQAPLSKISVAQPQANYAQGILLTIFPDVAADSDPANPRFLVTWGFQEVSLMMPNARTIEIQGQFVKADGSLDGSVQSLISYVDSDYVELLSSVAFSEESQEYVLAYQYYMDGAQGDYLRLARLDKQGAVVEAAISVGNVISGGILQPTVVAGNGGRFLTLWNDTGMLTGQVYESPNFDPNGGGSINPDPGTHHNNVEGTNGDSAINDSLCGGSVVNGNRVWLLESCIFFGFLLLLAGHFGARRTLRRFLGR